MRLLIIVHFSILFLATGKAKADYLNPPCFYQNKTFRSCYKSLCSNMKFNQETGQITPRVEQSSINELEKEVILNTSNINIAMNEMKKACNKAVLGLTDGKSNINENLIKLETTWMASDGVLSNLLKITIL